MSSPYLPGADRSHKDTAGTRDKGPHLRGLDPGGKGDWRQVINMTSSRGVCSGELISARDTREGLAGQSPRQGPEHRGSQEPHGRTGQRSFRGPEEGPREGTEERAGDGPGGHSGLPTLLYMGSPRTMKKES